MEELSPPERMLEPEAMRGPGRGQPEDAGGRLAGAGCSHPSWRGLD